MKTKKQHYVPQSYLEAFARGGRLSVFDKTTRATFYSSVRDAASPRFFYDIPELDQVAGIPQALEKFFQPFEDAAALVLKDLRRALAERRFVAVTQSQRIDLSLFLGVQMVRTPEAREHFAQFSLALHKQAFLAWVGEKHPQMNLDTSSFDLKMTEEQQRRTQASHILDPDLRERIAEIIFQHYWVILANPFSIPFITSDHPACNHGTVSPPVLSMQGLASFGAEVLFPLSPTHLLLIVERQAFPHAARFDARLSVLESVENVIYYNHWQVRHSFRFLYSISDDFSLARSMIEESPELANPWNSRIGVRRLQEKRGRI